MKKITLLATLAAALVVASCSTEKPETETGQPQEMEFSFTTENTTAGTRGTPITNGNTIPNAGTFKLYGYLNGSTTATINGATATVTSGKVSSLTGGPYYWPVSLSSSVFYAAYPATGPTIGATGAAGMTVNYVVPTVFANQQDVLWVRKTDAVKNQKVNLEFKHMLSRITFQCKLTANASNSTVKVTSISLKNMRSTGTLTVPPSADPSLATTTTVTTYTATIADANAKAISLTAKDLIDNPGGGTAVYTNVFADGVKDNSFIMMPMTTDNFTAAASSIDVVISIGGESKTFPISTATLVGKGGWASGKHINYRLALNVDTEKPTLVVEGVTVEDWGTPTDIDITLN